MMECHNQYCGYFNNGCTDKEQYDRCMGVIAIVQGNVNGCELCKEIYTDMKYPQRTHIARFVMGNDEIALFVPNKDGWSKVPNIKYCPMCGRKLV